MKAKKRKKPVILAPDKFTAYEVEAARLGLDYSDTPDMRDILGSTELREWVASNKLRRFVPLAVLSAYKTVVHEKDFLF